MKVWLVDNFSKEMIFGENLLTHHVLKEAKFTLSIYVKPLILEWIFNIWINECKSLCRDSIEALEELRLLGFINKSKNVAATSDAQMVQVEFVVTCPVQSLCNKRRIELAVSDIERNFFDF